MGARHLQGADLSSPFGVFQSTFFFSVQTLTTVGYGNLVPVGWPVNLAAAIESMTGLLGFAVATSLLFARFSRPSANIVFSRNVLIAPYQGRTALMFRVANRRPNVLMDLEARMLLMTVEGRVGQHKRRYQDLQLERPRVHFLPLSWTIVHPIDENSPLWGLGQDRMRELETELLILIKAFDNTFAQTVHARYSYRHEEVIWGARFSPAFGVTEDGDLVLEVDRLHQFEPVLPETPVHETD